MDDSKLIC